MASAPCVPIGPARIAPVFLLRVSGLPLSYTDALGSSAVRAAIEQARRLEQQIAGDAQILSDALHSAIAGATGKPAVQNSLLNLRRAVFNGRPVGTDAIVRAAGDLPGAVVAVLQRWHQLRYELEQHEVAAEQLVAHALPQARRALKRALAEEHLRMGLAIVNPAFERTLDAYLRADAHQCNRKLRQTERTALLYLMRTVHKTSPLSTLTMVSMGCFGGGTGMEPRWASWQPHHKVRPNVGTLSRIRQALSASAAHYPGLRLSLQQGAQREQDRVRYRQRREKPVQISGPMHSTVSEASFSLHLSSSLECLLDHLGAHRSCTVRQLIALLGTQLGMAETQAVDFLQRLVDQGLLAVDGLRQAMFEPDGWERFCAELEASGESALCSAARALRAAREAAERFTAARTDQRTQLLCSVNASLGEALALSGAAAEPPQPALYEDTSPSRHLTAASATPWRGLLEQLGAVQRLLGLFDPMLISRATLRSLFLKRFGAGGTCEDLIGFSDFFHDSFYRSMSSAALGARAGSAFGTGTLNPLRLQEVSAIQQAQAELVDAVEAAYSRHDGQGDIVLQEELVERLGARALGWQRWMSNAFFVQAMGRGSEASLVLNRIYGGAGCTFGRFTHLYDDADDEPARTLLRSSLASVEGGDMLFAELQGGHETNLNLHPLLAPCQLVLPGERASAGPEQRIALHELSIRHDPNRDMLYLYCNRLGKRIVPLYLGMLYPLILPELQTLLLHFAPPALLRTDAFDRAPAAAERIMFKPRVRHHQVYLERARWVVPASLLPRRADRESDYRYLRRLTDWRIAAGIPSQMFVKLLGLAAMQPASEKAGGFGFGRKPVYIDFDQPLSVALFAYLVHDAEGHVLLSERLPGSEDALYAPDGNRYTHEYVFELAQGTP